MEKVLSVFQLNTYIKRMMEQDFILKNMVIEGELSNFKRHSSGHYYFTLKDDKAQVSCVLFRSYTDGSETNLSNGSKVLIRGSVSLYEKTGQYQIYVRSIQASGLGELYLRFEQLKKTLEQEGLFEEEHKKTIPSYASKIGIVTSSTGAAIRDIVQVSKRRYPYVELVLFPSLVQGEQAKENIVEGIRYFNEVERVDVMIVGRGGGSIEDLWPFNEPEVAWAIYQSDCPVISAVGHETDFTIADFVADLRAPTPSAAAELAVFDYQSAITYQKQLRGSLDQSLLQYLSRQRERLEHLKKQLEKTHPRQKMEDRLNHLEQLRLHLIELAKHRFSIEGQRLSLLTERLNAKHPLKPLDDGFALIEKDGQRLRTIKSIDQGDLIDLYMKDGKAQANIVKTEEI